MEKDILKFVNSYSGSKLLEKYSLQDRGTWNVYGEDPNCDFGGQHSKPLLGVVEGKLIDVIKWGIINPNWNTWGRGGSITSVNKDSTRVYRV